MKEIAFQKIGGCAVPFSEEDAAKWAEFKENQVVQCKVYGAKKERSYPQLAMLHAAIGTVVENTEHKKLEHARQSEVIAKGRPELHRSWRYCCRQTRQRTLQIPLIWI